MSESSAAQRALVPPSPRVVFGFRFALIYGALTALVVLAVAGGVILATKPGPKSPPPWSSWRPAGGSVTKMTQEIADHIAPQYKSTKAGDQLVAIIPSTPEVTKNTAVTKISTIGFLSSASAAAFNRLISTSGNVQDQFCGIGTECAIGRGKATAAREQLVRREALEVALYTFKYVSSVKAVIAYLPPAPGSNPSTVLYLERSNLSKQLSQPLSSTLPLKTPPPPTVNDKKEKSIIDNLTIPVEYRFALQPLPDGTEGMVLVPS